MENFEEFQKIDLNLIKLYCLEHDIKGNQLAKLLGLSDDHVYKVLNGKLKFSTKFKYKFYKLLIGNK